jgi:DNA-binding FrmR family transcriptional regulator
MEENKTVRKDDILKRLRRIEGQVKGIQRMIEEDKQCVDILTQVSAIRAAINKVGGLILEQHSMKCIENAVLSEDREKAVNDLAKTMQSFMKFSD